MRFDVDEFMTNLKKGTYHQPEFHQAVHEVCLSLAPFLNANPRYIKYKVMERLVEPERTIIFRVPWLDDKGEIHVNRGYRVQFSSAIGPYKGGLRFHKDVNLSTLKFLGFEQIFKNSLTSLPMGGGKGGSDFDPKGKSDNEVMFFCRSFMSELMRHIGDMTDVPAGDIGVGGREIGYLFGAYKKYRNEFSGAITGKGVEWGGSLIRPEATGYGAVYLTEEMLKTRGQSIEGKVATVSGYGNVATYLIEKIVQLGGKVVTISNADGYVYDPDGISGDKLEYLKELQCTHDCRAKGFAEKFNLKWIPGKRPWEVPCDLAFPSAIQNELDEEDAKTLIKNGCICVVEGANMPSTEEAVKIFTDAKILYGPGKASNAGGVAVSGLEMSQNGIHASWSADKVDDKLREIMVNIHEKCCAYGTDKDGYINYVNGANIGGFIKVAEAIIAQGVI